MHEEDTVLGPGKASEAWHGAESLRTVGRGGHGVSV